MNENRLAYWLENEYGKSQPSSDPVMDAVMEATDRLYIDEVDADAIYKDIIRRTSHKNNKQEIAPSKTVNLKWIISLAASIAIILFACVYFFKGTHINTINGQQLVHILPDDSKVLLNAQSSIDYDKNFATNRILELDGEAFFEVEKGQKFTVNTSNGSVLVLGTSFNVFERNNSLVVACKTGQVKVMSLMDTVVLLPGRRARLDQNRLLLDSIPINNIGLWTEGESVFDSSPLKDVVASLAAQYNINVLPLPSKIRNERYTGSFVHNDLEKALKMVFLPMNVSYSLVDGDTLVVD